MKLAESYASEFLNKFPMNTREFRLADWVRIIQLDVLSSCRQESELGYGIRDWLDKEITTISSKGTANGHKI